MNSIVYYCGGRGAGGGGGGGAGGGGGGEAKPKRVRKLEQQLRYAKDRRRSVLNPELKVKWDKKVSDLTHRLTMARGKAGI